MPRLAKTRIVGTTAVSRSATRVATPGVVRGALPLALLLATAWCGTATSQSTVDNNQVQDGAVAASQTYDVGSASSDVTADTTSTGNGFIGSASSGSLQVESSQQLNGAVTASTTINAAGDARSIDSFTAATGNSGSSVIVSGGLLSGNFLQTSAAPRVDAQSRIEAPNSVTGDVAQTVQAVANAQTLGAVNSNIAANVRQTNSSTTTAGGGAVIGDVENQGAFTAIAAGNNLTSTGQGATGQDLSVSQTNNGDVTQAAMFVNLGQAEVAATSTVASGNNSNITNTEGTLTVEQSQDNQSFVHAQSVETAFDYGAGSASAEAVGNSAIAANVGPSLTLNSEQVNGAFGVEATASFQGDSGYDASASATATGNAITGFACSACGGVMNVNSGQINQGDVSASTQIGLTGSARSVRGVATAVGNTATFYTSQPN
jgi:hypothetical protein